MALVTHFRKNPMERNSIHDEIEASYSVFERDGRVIVQIDTHGRKDRQIPGKKSQTIQLDKTAAVALVRILSDAFKLG